MIPMYFSKSNKMADRKGRLDAVFMKAVDSSFREIDERTIQECFGDIKGRSGNKIQKLLMNMIGQAQVDLEVFKSMSINLECALISVLSSLELCVIRFSSYFIVVFLLESVFILLFCK